MFNHCAIFYKTWSPKSHCKQTLTGYNTKCMGFCRNIHSAFSPCLLWYLGFRIIFCIWMLLGISEKLPFYWINLYTWGFFSEHLTVFPMWNVLLSNFKRKDIIQYISLNVNIYAWIRGELKCTTKSQSNHCAFKRSARIIYSCVFCQHKAIIYQSGIVLGKCRL